MAIEDIGPTLIDLAWLGTYSLVAMAIWNFFMAAIGSDTEKTKEILKTDVGKTAKDYLPSIFGKEKTAEVKNQEHTAIVEDWKKKIGSNNKYKH